MTLIAIVALGACQASSSGTTSRTTTGENLGKRAWHQVTLDKSQISLVGDQSSIIRREANFLPSRYQERWRVKGGGGIFFEELYSSYFGKAYDPRDTMIERANRSLKNFGMSVQRDEVKRVNFQENELFYVHKRDQARSCFIFRAGFGDMQYGLGNKALSGSVCHFNKESALGPNLETAMLDLLRRMRFDDGAINKTLAAATPPAAANVYRPVTIKWEGRPDVVRGNVLLNQNGRSGRISLTVPGEGANCAGTYAITSEAGSGDWSVSCGQGISAKGTFQSFGRGKGAAGSGTDNQGRKVEYRIEAAN